MKAVILAAGEGSRMRPLTTTRPKVMLPLANKPLLEHIIQTLKDCNINDIILICGYKSQIIKDYFNDGKKLNVNIKYALQEEQLGTAHAIQQAEPFINEDFLLLNGDVLTSKKHIHKMKNFPPGDALLTVKRVEKPQDFGVIETKGTRVTNIVEKPIHPRSNLANAGIYRFTEEIFDYIKKTPASPRGEYEITTTLQKMITENKHIEYIQMNEDWLDVGRPWDLLDANTTLLKNIQDDIKGDVEPYATIKPPVIIEEGTIIRNGAYIIGPVTIGKNCDIGPNCYIRPHTSIQDNVKIGNAVEVKNSIIMNNTNIGHLSYVGDSIISEHCNFGAGTKIANLRHDGHNIKVHIKGEVVDSGRRKLGAIIGDNVHTGINSMINVGTTIDNNTHTLPGEFVKGHKTHTR